MSEKLKAFLGRPTNLMVLTGAALCALGIGDGLAERYLGVDVIPGVTTWTHRRDYVPSSLNALKILELEVDMGRSLLDYLSGKDAFVWPHADMQKGFLDAPNWTLREWTATLASASFIAGMYTPSRLPSAKTACMLSASLFGASFGVEQLGYLSVSEAGLSIPDALIWSGTTSTSSALAIQRGKRLLNGKKQDGTGKN